MLTQPIGTGIALRRRPPFLNPIEIDSPVMWFQVRDGWATAFPISVFGRISEVTAESGDYNANQVTFTPYGSDPGTDVQGAMEWIIDNVTGLVTAGNLTEATSNILTITGGTGAVIGLGTTIQIKKSTSLQDGYLSSTDWSTFNSKEPAISSGVLGQYWRYDKTWANLTTTIVSEGSNLYYTDERVDDRVAVLIQNGTGITWTYNDAGNTLTGNVTITQYTDEMSQDATASLIQNGTGITWVYNDGANTLTPTVTITQYTDALARASISETITGIDYDNTTGIFSITVGYTIPTSALLATYVTASSATNFTNKTGNISQWTNDSGYLLSNQTITLSSEASGTGTTSISVTLSNAAVIAKVLTGYTSGAGTISSLDSILTAIQKLNGNIGALTTGVSSVTGTSNRITTSPTTGAVIVDIANTYVGQTSIITLGTIGTGTWQGNSISTTYTDAKIKTVTGTANRLTITGTSTDPIFDISSLYIGQATITTLGTISTGTWQATLVSPTYGGTGVNNSTRTITINTSNAAFTFSGAFTLTIPATGTAVLGTGATSKLSYWTGTNTQASDSNTLFDGTSYLFGYTALASAELMGIQKNQNAATYFAVTNTTSGTAGFAGINVSNSATISTSVFIRALSAGWTTSGMNVASTGIIGTSVTGGLNVGSTSNAQLGFWTNNTEVGRFNSTGEFGIGMTAVQFVDVTKTQNAATVINLTNGNNGSSANARVTVNNSSKAFSFTLLGTGFTTSGLRVADTAELNSTGTGGLNIYSNTSGGIIRFAVGGTGTANEVVRADVSGLNFQNLLTSLNFSAANKMCGQATLVLGTIAVTITGLTTAHRAFVTIVTAAGTLGNGYKAVCTANTLTITSETAGLATQTLDISTVNYLVVLTN